VRWWLPYTHVRRGSRCSRCSRCCKGPLVEVSALLADPFKARTVRLGVLTTRLAEKH
jgi:hypothetical protein